MAKLGHLGAMLCSSTRQKHNVIGQYLIYYKKSKSYICLPFSDYSMTNLFIIYVAAIVSFVVVLWDSSVKFAHHIFSTLYLIQLI